MSEDVCKKDSELAPLLEYFGERVNRVFAYFFFELEFEGDEDMRGDSVHNDRTWMLEIMENACIHDTLMALRDLDDFFTERKTKSDDLRASAFGMENGRGFLAVDERGKINKLIAHTTTVGAQTQEFRWDIWELTFKGITQTLEFLQWVEKEYGARYFHLWTAAIVIRKKVDAVFSSIKREVEKRRGRASN